MSISFICSEHKEWLYFHSEQSIGFIEDAHRKGQYLLDQAQWRKAVPFLGAAFEATEILLELYGNNENWLLCELSLVTTQLMECLTKAGANEHANSISHRALIRLDNALQEQSTNVNAVGFLQHCIDEINSAPHPTPNLARNSSVVNSSLADSSSKSFAKNIESPVSVMQQFAEKAGELFQTKNYATSGAR